MGAVPRKRGHLAGYMYIWRREGLPRNEYHCHGGHDIEAIIHRITKHLRSSHPDVLPKARPENQEQAKKLLAMRLDTDIEPMYPIEPRRKQVRGELTSRFGGNEIQ